MLVAMPCIVAFCVPVASTMSGTWALLWDLRGHLPFFKSSPIQWFHGPTSHDAPWLATATLVIWLTSFLYGLKWLMWVGEQYAFRSASAGVPPIQPRLLLKSYRPLPPCACPPGTHKIRQELRCAIAFVTGFLAYAWFVVSAVVGFYFCAASRAMEVQVGSLTISHLLWWRQAFPEHWPPNLIFEVLCLFVLSVGLLWLGSLPAKTPLPVV